MMNKSFLSNSNRLLLILIIVFTSVTTLAQVNLLTTGSVNNMPLESGIMSINTQRQVKFLHSFPIADPTNSYAMIKGSDGKIYGTTHLAQDALGRWNEAWHCA